MAAPVKIAALAFAVAALACLPAESRQAPAAPAFDGGRAYGHLRQIVAFGPRPAGSPALEQTRGYIEAELKKIGLEPAEQAFDAATPVGTLHMVNVRATIPGKGEGRIVIAGHYDTKLFHAFPFVGANDGGSSAAFLIELARVLAPLPHPVSIELLFLDGEESTGEWAGTDHTYGSRYYVDAARRDGSLKSLRALILVDMIGDRDLDIMREQNSTPWLTDAIWSAARRLNRPEFLEQSTPIEDDHDEFLDAGVESVDIIDLDYPNAWHEATDDLQHVSARSLQAVGDVLLAALPGIEQRVQGF